MNATTAITEVYGRLDVTIPEAEYEAGKVSTVSLLLRNPFDTPVEILDIQGPRSPHLGEVLNNTNLLTDENDRQVVTQSSQKIGWIQKLTQGVRFSEISFGGISLEFPSERKSLNISAEPNSEVEFNADLHSYDSINVSAEQGSKINISPPETKQPKNQTMSIQPHCEAVRYFEISTAGWLFFKPTRQTLNTQIRYRIGGQEKSQVITTQFDVKPPLLSMVVGAVVGAVLGSLANVLTANLTLQWQALAVNTGASVVMSLIATIALSRKTGAQGFITVEDFFGGFVVGALIGYGGTSYFERAIMPEASKQP